MLAGELTEAITVVCPIYSVSIGVNSDKATWRIDFVEDVTDQQKNSAISIMESFQ